LVELLLGLSKPTIGPAIGQPAAIVIHVIPVVPSLTGSSSTAIPLSRLMLAWHVAINMVRRGFGDIAASVASDSPSTVLIASNCTSAFACWTGPPVISIPWSTDTVKKASFWLLDVVKWISAASPAPSWRRKKSQPNGLPLSVCAVKLANCSFSIVYVSIYDKGSALGATSTIIANIDAGDRSDSCEEAPKIILRKIIMKIVNSELGPRGSRLWFGRIAIIVSSTEITAIRAFFCVVFELVMDPIKI
jgi:hypothetical protein